MALNVKFLKGTAAQYAAATIDVNTFYYVDEADLYLGSVKLSSAADLAAAIVRIAANETNIGDITALTTTQKASLVVAVNELKSEIAALTGGESGGISDMIEAVTGDLTDLTTDAKTNLVAAINELDAALDAEKTNSVVTVETSSADAYAQVYTVKQGGTTVGTINIPKDMVVQSGQVVVNPEGQAEGTYIELTLANANNDKIYVNVGTLVDIYTAEANAAQIQLTINSATREISAVIVDGSVDTDALAASAVTTAKIADGNVTKAKLATDVQTSLGKADSAVQSVTEGSTNGTVSVDGTDVSVKGLGSAAYTDSTAYDAAGSADAAKTAVIGSASDASSADTVNGAKAYADEKISEGLTWGTIA